MQSDMKLRLSFLSAILKSKPFEAEKFETQLALYVNKGGNIDVINEKNESLLTIALAENIPAAINLLSKYDKDINTKILQIKSINFIEALKEITKEEGAWTYEIGYKANEINFCFELNPSETPNLKKYVSQQDKRETILKQLKANIKNGTSIKKLNNEATYYGIQITLMPIDWLQKKPLTYFFKSSKQHFNPYDFYQENLIAQKNNPEKGPKVEDKKVKFLTADTLFNPNKNLNLIDKEEEQPNKQENSESAYFNN